MKILRIIDDDLAIIKIIDKPKIVEIDKEPFEPVFLGDSWFIFSLRE